MAGVSINGSARGRRQLAW